MGKEFAKRNYPRKHSSMSWKGYYPKHDCVVREVSFEEE